MIKEDKILDIRDNLNAFMYCLKNNLPHSVSVKSEDVLKSIDLMKSTVREDIDFINSNEMFKGFKSDRIKSLLQGKMSTRISLLYKADELKSYIKTQPEYLNISQNLLNFLQNDI